MRHRNVWIAGVTAVVGLVAQPVWAQDVGPRSLDEVSRDLVGALHEVCTDVELRDNALETPELLLEMAGTSLPEGFELSTFRPEENWFEPRYPTIELTHCRAYWICEPEESVDLEFKPCKFKEEKVCLGFRIVAATYPWGPYAL